VDEAEVEAEEEEEVPEIGWDEEDQKKITVSYACDECDYRWDDVIIRKKDVIEEEEPDIICPMCGSMNVTLI
jgi:Zn finger protein HypA/HybF involved in hydrogenase expression